MAVPFVASVQCTGPVFGLATIGLVGTGHGTVQCTRMSRLTRVPELSRRVTGDGWAGYHRVQVVPKSLRYEEQSLHEVSLVALLPPKCVALLYGGDRVAGV